MLGVTHYETGQPDETRYYLRWPEEGGLKTILEVLFVAYLVVVATPAVAAEIAIVQPAIVPEPFVTIVYVSLWIGFIGFLVSILRSGSLVSTYQFDERAAFEYRIERDAPDSNWAVRHGGLVALGAAVCWGTHERFISTLLEVIDLLVVVVSEFQLSVTPLDGLAVIGFLVGFLLVAVGADRLFVDGVRWYIRQQQADV